MSAVGNHEVIMGDEVHTDGTLPLLLEFLRHLHHLVLDVCGDFPVVCLRPVVVVLVEGILVVLVRTLVILAPRKLHPLVSVIQLGLELLCVHLAGLSLPQKLAASPIKDMRWDF